MMLFEFVDLKALLQLRYDEQVLSDLSWIKNYGVLKDRFPHSIFLLNFLCIYIYDFQQLWVYTVKQHFV